MGNKAMKTRDSQNSTFRAVFDDGVVCIWHPPQTWRHVFHSFKLAGAFEGHGFLFCNGVAIRETGKKERRLEDDLIVRI